MYLQDLLGDAYKEGMTLEEVSQLLETEKIGRADTSALDKKDAEIKKLKETLSKKNSEAADYKKQYEAYLSEEEKKKLEDQAKWEAIAEENKTLKRDKSISDYTAQFLGLGYSADLAKDTAVAMTDGDFTKVMECQKTFAEETEKKIRAEVMRGNPDPVGGRSESTMTLDKLRKMSMEDRYAFSQEHPDEYKDLYEKEN